MKSNERTPLNASLMSISSVDELTQLDTKTTQSLEVGTPSLMDSQNFVKRHEAKELAILKEMLAKSTEKDQEQYLLKNAEFNKDVRLQFNRY